jgi:hypothetical protein
MVVNDNIDYCILLYIVFIHEILFSYSFRYFSAVNFVCFSQIFLYVFANLKI